MSWPLPAWSSAPCAVPVPESRQCGLVAEAHALLPPAEVMAPVPVSSLSPNSRARNLLREQETAADGLTHNHKTVSVAPAAFGYLLDEGFEDPAATDTCLDLQTASRKSLLWLGFRLGTTRPPLYRSHFSGGTRMTDTLNTDTAPSPERDTDAGTGPGPDTHAVRQIGHWLSGVRVAGTSGRSHDVTDPATGRVSAHVALANSEEVNTAATVATAAAREWGKLSLSRRNKVLFRFRELLQTRADDVAALITAEHGKVLSDARGEVERGLEVVEFACGLPHLLKGEANENVSTRIDIRSMRQPLGVVAIVSPFNFPAMVPLWFLPIALAAGNAVIFKPSERDPSAGMLLAELWAEAGLPDGVLTVLNGDAETVTALLDHPDIAALSFVGSTPVARAVYERGTRAGKRVQALGGAKNHMVVLPDADLDLAADAAVNAGFGSAGERCMAISAVVAVGPIADDLVQRIADRARTLRTGDGRRACDMGPLVTGQYRDKVRGYVDAGVEAGATLVVDGRDVVPDGDPDGFWLGPTLFDEVAPDMAIYTDEIFGPVLSVLRVETFDDALDLVNSNDYGNGTAIFTNDGGAARRYADEVTVGMVGVNVPIPVPMAYFSFGGWKSSLFGDLHVHGREGVLFYTRGKVVTERWPESASGVDYGFPTQS